MAEPMPALTPLSNRRPPARKPRLPHPHLEPPPRAAESATDSPSRLTAPAATAEAALPRAESWTPAAVPMARPAGRPRKHRISRTPAERTLRYALRFGFFVNGAALLAPRLFPSATFPAWEYSGDDFLLAAAVLLSGQILLILGRGAPRRQG